MATNIYLVIGKKIMSMHDPEQESSWPLKTLVIGYQILSLL